MSVFFFFLANDACLFLKDKTACRKTHVMCPNSWAYRDQTQLITSVPQNQLNNFLFPKHGLVKNCFECTEIKEGKKGLGGKKGWATEPYVWFLE